MRSTRYTKEFKEMVIEEIKQGADVAQVARKHEISPKTVYNWLIRAKHKDWENTPRKPARMFRLLKNLGNLRLKTNGLNAFWAIKISKLQYYVIF